MKKIFLIALIVFGATHAQNLDITIRGINTIKIHLYSLQGEKTSLIDSIFSREKDKFKFVMERSKTHTGFYRLLINNKTQIDFINDGEDISIKTDATNILDSMEVISSEGNRLFYNFIKLNKQYKAKSELLQLMLARFPKDDEYYKTTKDRLQKLQNEYLEFVNVTSQKEPNSFSAKYIKSSQLPVLDLNLPADKQLAYLKKHALDKVDFTNSLLTYSDLFTNKTIEYLTYYRNPQLPKELLEKEFTKAVDSVLARAKVHQLVYQHIVEYLIDGFKKFGFDNIIDYIVSNYVIKDDLCLDSKTESSIQRRIDQNKKLPIGASIPNIIMNNEEGNEVNLAKIKNDKMLIVFYASWCPHCQTLLPELAKYYKEIGSKRMEVIAVSLDEKKEDWLNFVENNKLNWINLSDQLGWGSKTSNDYYIYATPTLFLVNKDKKIIGKPLTMDDLKKLLN